MQLVLVTGLSGSGKSIAIRQLEDCGYYCIDNLPAEFLLPIARKLREDGTRAAAVAIDARSHATYDTVIESLSTLAQEHFDIRVLFLTASDEELVRRFSETRRRHPLSTKAEHHDEEVTLLEAIRTERRLLDPFATSAHVIDTTQLLPAQLRNWVQSFIEQPAAKMTLTFESFAFKLGVPGTADLVFDVRCLPNPYYDPELRVLTGRDAPVAAFLEREPLVAEMIVLRIVGFLYQLDKLFHRGRLHQRLELVMLQAVLDGNGQGINIRRDHMVILLRTVDPLQVQKIDLRPAVPGEKFFLFPLQQALLLSPKSGEIIQIQGQVIVE